MTRKQVGDAVVQLAYLMTLLDGVMSKHSAACACSYCTAALAVNLAHSHLLAALEDDETEDGEAE